MCFFVFFFCVVFFQAEDGIRDLVRSRGLGDVYKRQPQELKRVVMFNERARLAGSRSTISGFLGIRQLLAKLYAFSEQARVGGFGVSDFLGRTERSRCCLLYTSDAADERSSVDLGGRRIIKKKKKKKR